MNNNPLLKGFVYFIIILVLVFLFVYILKLLSYQKVIEIKSLPEELDIKLKIYQEVLKQGLEFKDYIVLLKIAYAESCFRHFIGNKVIEGVNKYDKGLFQINTLVHKVNAEDIDTNIQYAVKLYKEKGTKHWIYSQKNWSKSLEELKKKCYPQ